MDKNIMMSTSRMALLTFLGLLMLTHPCHAEPGLQGLWLTEDDESTVEMTPTKEGWVGRIVALREPLDPDGKEKTDFKNPDPTRRQDPILGLRIIWGFKAMGDNAWAGGSVYDPNNGKTYHAKITLRDRQLHLRGSLDRWGIAGRSTLWKRPNPKDAP